MEDRKMFTMMMRWLMTVYCRHTYVDIATVLLVDTCRCRGCADTVLQTEAFVTVCHMHESNSWANPPLDF